MIPRFHSLPPLSLYVHIPWCVRKCPYCDFNSHEADARLDEQLYRQALIADLEASLPLIWGRRVVTVFFGGGTPSLMSPEFYDQLLSDIRARLQLPADCETTLEANPGTVEHGRFSEYAAAGINRFSIGVQSFDDTLLERIGRIHDGAQVRLAIDELHRAGIDNFNLDLMFALPGQSQALALADLEQALAAGATHLSWYQLTIEPNTAFHHSPPEQPGDEALWVMQQQGQAMLAAAGFEQYEVSAWSRPGRQCQHNLNYWRFGDYLGIGAGAHSKITDGRHQQVSRYRRQRHPAAWRQAALSGNALSGQEVLNWRDLRYEFVMNVLRLKQGFDKRLFQDHTGLSISLLNESLTPFLDRGLMTETAQRWQPTERGFRFLDSMLVELE